MAGESTWRSAMITGAASGIGRCFAETLTGHGVAVGLLDVSVAGLATVADGIRARGGRLETRVGDVGAGSEVGAAVDAFASAFGGLDLVVHCAAIAGAGRFAEQAAEEFDRTIRINLLGTVNVVRAALPALRQSRGAVACLASTAALHGWPGLVAYSAAKFGVVGFCDAVRSEVARDGITVTTVFPLLIDTPLLAAADKAPILKQGTPIPPQAVVDKTLAAVAARRARVFIPGSARFVGWLHGVAPSVLDRYGRRFG